MLTELISAIAPSVASGLFLWYAKRCFDKQDAKYSEKEKARHEHDALILKGVFASLSLGDATAEAIQKGHCNGELSKAREYAEEAKHDMRDFINEYAAKNLK